MGNGEVFNCPYCPQTSTRQWNLKRHIQRWHGPAAKSNNEPFAGSTPAVGVKSYSIPRNASAHLKNNRGTSNVDQMSECWQKALEPWQEALKPLQELNDLMESWSKLKHRFSVSRSAFSQQLASFPFLFSFPPPNSNNQQPSVSPSCFSQPTGIRFVPSGFSQHSSMEAPGSGCRLGYKGFVCKKCFYAGIYSIQASSFRGSLNEPEHPCSQASIQESPPSHQFSWALHDREHDLIFYLKRIIDKTTQKRELTEVLAVEIPYFKFGPESSSYEEYVHMDPIRRPVPRWMERTALQSGAIINKGEVLEFLEVFVGTLGYFRIRVHGLPHYFFIYMSNGLEPEDFLFP